ncbi:MAG: squalene synthase HpnC [Lautropia sp.]|nr:squalene synthase HpnC [Lautropia sp.]
MSETKPWHGVDHPENFPVGSWLVPAHLRPGMLAIYRFARHADDLADEGDASAEARDAALMALDTAVQRAAAGEHSGVPVVDGLIGVAARHQLGWQYFRDLIDAFRQDLYKTRYVDTAEVLDYSRRSADPVGRLVLQLFGAYQDVQNRQESDAICSALQRINFLQDIGIDALKGRVYLPASTLAEAGTDAETLLQEALAGRLSDRSRQAVALELARARRQLFAGRALPSRLPFRLATEIRFILAGGNRILDRIEAAAHDPVAHRPVLGWRDAPALLKHVIHLPHEV